MWRISSPTRSWRCEGPAVSGRDDLGFIALHHVAFAQILEAGEGQAAFVTARHFLHVILEALELRQLALMDDDIVAQQTHAATALDQPFGNVTTRDLAGLGDVEDLADFRVAEEFLA